MTHYFLTCNKVKEFWSHWYNWWDSTTQIDISKINNNEASKYILFGYPGVSDVIEVLNFCVLLAKYHIYTARNLNNDNVCMYEYLVLLKNKLNIEKLICEKQNQGHHFNKFDFVYDNL